jgi:hypothetical protein
MVAMLALSVAYQFTVNARLAAQFLALPVMRFVVALRHRDSPLLRCIFAIRQSKPMPMPCKSERNSASKSETIENEDGTGRQLVSQS